ncbi:MAG TPA: hypothetical protein VFE62_00825 [Gemmataceae bacterium]|nr:hypothetical protein [Gemmataceae bacterium]
MSIKRSWELTSLLVVAAVLFLSAGTEICNAQDKVDEIKTLKKERRDLLSQAAAQLVVLYQNARVDLYELVKVDRDLLRADLDWFEKPADRIKAIEQHKEIAEMAARVAKSRRDSGRGGEAQVLQARAYALEVQIELLKEKRKVQPAK